MSMKKAIVDFVLGESMVAGITGADDPHGNKVLHGSREKSSGDGLEKLHKTAEETIHKEITAVPKPWSETFRRSILFSRFNLHCFNPCIREILDLWFRSYRQALTKPHDFLLINVAEFGPRGDASVWVQGGLRLEDFIGRSREHLAHASKHLNNVWFVDVVRTLRRERERRKWLPPETKLKRLKSFFECLAVLQSSLLEQLARESLEALTSFLCSPARERRGNQNYTHPGFVINLVLEDTSIKFQPSFQEFEESILSLYDSLLEVVSHLPRVDNTVYPNLDFPDGFLKPCISKELVSSLRDRVRTEIRTRREAPTQHLHQYDQYAHLYSTQAIYRRGCQKAEVELEAFLAKGEYIFKEYVDAVDKYQAMAEGIQESCVKTKHTGFFEVHSEELISSLVQTSLDLKEKVVADLQKKHCAFMTDLGQEYSEIARRALATPPDTAALMELRAFMSTAEALLLPKLEQQLMEAVERMYFLNDHTVFSTTDIRLNNQTIQWIFRMPTVFEEHRDIMQQKRREYEGALKYRRDRFVEELESYDKQVEELRTYGAIEDLPKYLKKAQALDEKLRVAAEKVEAFNVEETSFDWPRTEYPLRKRIVEKLTPFLQLYTTAMDFITKQNSWLETAAGAHEPSAIEADTLAAWKAISKLEKGFAEIPDTKFLINSIRTRIEEFREHLPLVHTLCNPGLRDRHWEQVSEIVGYTLEAGPDLTLAKLIDLSLEEYIAKFQGISDSATKEHRLEQSMENMVSEWTDMEFLLEPHRETGTHILTGVEDIQVLLDDHIVKTQTMRGSPFVKPFQKEVSEWEAKLVLLQDIVDEWMSVQATWLSLEPIFSSPDIMAQMPEEGRRFITVDKNWRDIMKSVLNDSRVLTVIQIERMLDRLRKCSELLELILRGIHGYLDRKRLYFPRFFFLSNGEMLNILSETKSPANVQVHLKKCLPGITSLSFDDDLQIVSVHSALGETLPLTLPVSTSKARGQVEKWLAELQDQVRTSLAMVAKEAAPRWGSGGSLVPVPSVRSLPSQLGLVLWALSFSACGEAAMTQGPSALQTLREQVALQIQEALSLVQAHGQQGPTAESVFMRSLLAVMLQARDTLEQLLKESVTSPLHFLWQKSLRYEWKDDDICVSVMFMEHAYCYEYLGTVERMFLTPTLERVFVTMLTSLQFYLGGLVQGPVCSGKTEAVKELGRTLAKNFVHFSCSPALELTHLCKLIKGTAACGAWLCLDELDRVSASVLSAFSGTLLSLQRAVRGGEEYVNMEGSDIDLNVNARVFAIASQGELPHRNALPENLKVREELGLGNFMLKEKLGLGKNGNGELGEEEVGLENFMVREKLGMGELHDEGERGSEELNGEGESGSGELHGEGNLGLGNFMTREKSFFRPLWVDSLDVHLILECRLLCDGFRNPRKLATNLIRCLQLIYDILSTQKHYQFDYLLMDLVIRRLQESLRRLPLDERGPREVPLLWGALREALLPRVTSEDVAILRSQFRFLFTTEAEGTEAEVEEAKVTEVEVEEVLAAILKGKVLEPQPYFLSRVRALEASVRSRSALILLGDPMAGKTTALDVVAALIAKSEGAEVQRVVVSPNSMCPEQLFGSFNKDSKDWADGIIPRALRNFAKPTNAAPQKWLILDGPADSEVLENLNSLLDRSGRLCLVSTDVISLSPSSRIIVETNDIDCLSPALICRCDVVYMHSGHLGWEPLARTWLRQRNPALDGAIREHLEQVFRFYCPPLLRFLEPLQTPSLPCHARLWRDITAQDPSRLPQGKYEWQPWSSALEASAAIPRELHVSEVIVPTVETLQFQALTSLLVSHGSPVLWTGESGTGKSMYIQQFVRHQLDPQRFTWLMLALSPHSDVTRVQEIVLGQLDKRRKGEDVHETLEFGWVE
ncbi:unnamed protein product [Cyprideis torosa]|uniref:Uncharacterized protein n=1 Tax=Cyprideis torosa TaxID=163714 RepID=A0A7R8WLA3_9CRUS|nr:unnamed protein product [Cyprideis torosa]CAG0897967.1 unnamed protein product [Cyprideis torosa]